MRIIAEKYIENEEGDLWDYKIWCFNGVVKYIQLDRNRFKSHVQRFYSPTWEPLPFIIAKHVMDKNIADKPSCLEEMIEVAQKLSKGFPFVRVDLYCVKDKIYFGEMTFNPLAGVFKWIPENMDNVLGDMLKLN